MYKRYIKKRGKLTGPYYYTSIRLKTGKIKTVYIGKNPNSKEFKNKVTLLNVQSAVSKGNSIVIPIEPGDVVHRPKRPSYLKPDLIALKQFFGEKFSDIKSNITIPKFDLIKFKSTLSKFKLPELKTAKEFYQRKLDEYLPKPGLKDFNFHTALVILLSVIFVFSFLLLQNSFTGYSTVLNESFLEKLNTEKLGSGSEINSLIEESSATELIINVLNYSCSWNGSIFRVCETVEWSGGRYAKGYISGGDSIKDAEAFAISPFTYCQDVDKEGKKAVNAYLYDNNGNITKKDLSNKVECLIGNTLDISNESLINIAEPSLNESNVSEIVENLTVINENLEPSANMIINKIEVTEANVTIKTNESAVIEQTIQYQAVIGKPVKWLKKIKLENETTDLEIELPKGSKVVSVRELENEQIKDITSDVFASATPITGLSFLLTGLAIADEVNATSVIIEQPVSEVEIEYETEAPTLKEEEIDNGRRITLSSNVHYKNVYAEIKIPESRGELIRLYWIVNGTRELHPIIDYDDNNFDGFIDEIAFVAPHLSSQEFELIYITKAEHLDENYTFISNVYNETVELDDVWSEKIYHNEYVRVTFEKNLTSDNDITVYPRNIQGSNITVEVYYYNTSIKITEFPLITEENYYKVFLDSMNGSYATFDLKIKNLENDDSSYLEFDYIVDPTIIVIGGNEAHDVGFAIMNGSIGEFVMAWCDDVADTAIWEGFFTNGSNYTVKHRIQATAGDNCRIGISALNDSDFALAAIDLVSSAAPDWVVYAKTKTNGSVRERTLLDTDVAGTGYDVAVAALNETSYVSFANDGAEADVTYAIHNRAAGTALNDIDLSVTTDAGCLDQDCVDIATIGNVSSAVGNRTRAMVWYDDTSDNIQLAIMNGNNQNITGATQAYAIVDAPGTAAAVSVTGLYDGRIVVAWCDDTDQDVSFKTYDVAINSSVLSNVSGEIDVNTTSGNCEGAVGTKVDVAALNTTDGQFVIAWDDARINHTSIAVYYSNGSRKVAQTIINTSTDTAEKAISVVGYDVMRNVSVCEHAPLPAFVVAWNEVNNFYWRTMLNNGSTWDGTCVAPASGDTTPPSNVTLINPPNNTINASRIHRFIANATEETAFSHATLWHNISGSFVANQTLNFTGTNNQTNFTVNLITDGGYTWYVEWCDTSANCNQSSTNFTFRVDATRPSNVNLTMPPNNAANRSSTWQFQSNASDVLGLVNATLYHNISGSWSANQTVTVSGTSGVVTSFNVSVIVNGTYSWNVQWCDTVGNCNQSNNNFTFTVDTVRPASVNISSPPNNTLNKSTTWRFDSNATDNISFSNASLYHNISGSWVRNQTVTVAGSSGVVTSFNVSKVVDGGYTWNVEWCDAASNCNQSKFNFTFFVDNTTPSIVNLINPSNRSINISRSYTFFGNATDNRNLSNASLYHNESGTFSFNRTVEVSTNGTFSNWSINVSGFNDTGLVWSVLVCDIANNCNWSNLNRTLTINNPPSGINLTNPANATSNTSPNHVFYSNASDIRQLANATLYHNFTGTWHANKSNLTINGTTNTSSISVTGLVNGTNVWNVLWCDTDSNCSWATSNNTLTVGEINSAPPIPELLDPSDNNVTTNRSPYFSWSDSIDPDGDPVNYTLNITCRGGCASDTRIINVVNRTNYTLVDDLEFFADDGYNYTWTVLATDGTLNSSYNESARNFSIYTLVDISLPSGNVSFGSMTLGAWNDTDDGSPAPFRLQNNGNILINISINGTSLWTTNASPTSLYQYKIDDVSGEENSFVSGSSNTTYTNMPLVDNVAIVGLNHTDVTDSCQIDINITVPSAEPPANLTSTILFRGAR